MCTGDISIESLLSQQDLCSLSGGIFQRLFHPPRQIGHGLGIAGEAVPGDGPFAVQGRIGEPAEFFPLVNIREMDFHRRNGGGLQRVQHGHAGVGVGGGVDDDAVHPVEIRPLDAVHQRALVVGLEKFHGHAQGVGFSADQGAQVIVGAAAIDRRLPDAQQV